MFQRKSYERGLTSFLREARTLARFEHPSIVRVTRVFEANKTAYMVMRLETGHNFEDWLRTLTRSPTQKELDTFLSALLSAMEMLHAAGFLHRDIAPDNIIIRSDGLPVLLDFGAVTSKQRSLRFAKHDVIIKPRYSAPEHYDANSAARTEGPWSDIYSLGATLFRAVKGIPPAEAHIRLREDYLPTAVDPGPHSGYRRNFLDAIDACVKLQPKERPQSVLDLRDILSGYARNRPATRQEWRPTQYQGYRQAGIVMMTLSMLLLIAAMLLI